MSSDTHAVRPGGPRAPDLWRAWERTAGYVARHVHQDVAVSLTWNAAGPSAPWMAQFTWANNNEFAGGHASPGEALVALWQQIEAGYAIFESQSDAGHAPRGYPPDYWFQEAEHAIMDRLMRLAVDRYDPPATLVIAYHPLGSPESRSQARLISHSNAPTVGGQGATLLDACRDLYRQAALKLGTKEE